MKTENARVIGRKYVQESVAPDIWEKNRRFGQNMQALLAKHPMSTHPLLDYMDNETLSKKASLQVHLEFGFAFAQIFTDAVCMAMATCGQLEVRLGPKAKTSARFLWGINCMDEAGFVPSNNGENFVGNPLLAHYYQYMSTIEELGGSNAMIVEFQPSMATLKARKTFEDQYDSYLNTTAVLALSESIFDKFATAWANNVEKSTEVDTTKGYHTIHVEDDAGESIDDDHSEDGWYLFAQAVHPEVYQEVEDKMRSWLDDWYAFADHVLEICMNQ